MPIKTNRSKNEAIPDATLTYITRTLGPEATKSVLSRSHPDIVARHELTTPPTYHNSLSKKKTEKHFTPYPRRLVQCSLEVRQIKLIIL